MGPREDNLTLEEERSQLFEQGSRFAPVQRDEIVGIDAILDRLDPIIFWLQNSNFNIRVEPGVLFHGSPGTGKTLCARYLATQSNALFINVREWPLWTNEFTARDIKDLFDMSRRHYQLNRVPVILFWDEFEQYAQDRSISSSRAGAIVSQITAELDGILGKCPGVLLIGCTNYRDPIDPALVRAGRMGMHFMFRPPDREGKKILLQHYLSKYDSEDIDFEAASELLSDDMTAAEVEEIVNNIWLNTIIGAIEENRNPIVTDKTVRDTLVKHFVGDPASFVNLDRDSSYHIATHELGHALIARALDVPVKFVTIQPGESLGKTLTIYPNENLLSVSDSINQIKVAMGGIYAERALGLPDLVNSQKDIYRATILANRITGTHGVTIEGKQLLIDFFGFDVKDRSVSSCVSPELKVHFDNELIGLILTCQDDVEWRIGQIGEGRISELANKLVEEVTWTGKDFERTCQELMIP